LEGRASGGDILIDFKPLDRAVAPLVRAQDLDKSYGGRRLFEAATFEIASGEHVAIVGANGAGKTTLLRILAGRDRPDHGLLEVAPGVRTHWFDQHPDVPATLTAREALSVPPPVPAPLAAELATLEARIGDPALYETGDYAAVLDRYAEVQRAIRTATIPTREAAENPLAAELGLEAGLLDQPMGSLSGGQRTRVLLARVLAPARAEELLVLDEPTNHLDVETLEWLEAWIQSYEGTVLVVAHDRLFLDNVAERVLEVAASRVTSYPGNYTDYVALRTQRRETAAREHDRLEREVSKAQATIQQFRHQKRFDGQMASRQRLLEKYQAALDRTPDPVVERLTFALRFDAVHKSSTEVVHATGLRKAFGSQPVLDRAELEVRKGDRVGLVGPNGAGKSTLLKILARRLRPDDGVLRIPPGVQTLYYSQERDDLEPNRTLRQELLAARAGLEEDDQKALLGRFRFQPETDLDRRVSTLSGGERARLSLLKTILLPSNLLLLDEPTNHLDLEAREVVIHALNAYKGTLIIVSHDRYLLDSVTTHTAVLDEGRIAVHPGAFTATRHLHRHARTLAVRRDRYRVTKGFKDFATGDRYTYGTELELSPEELEASDVFRRAFRFGMLTRLD
jgi:ATP-binding cassette, subfamily F, member 3